MGAGLCSVRVLHVLGKVQGRRDPWAQAQGPRQAVNDHVTELGLPFAPPALPPTLPPAFFLGRCPPWTTSQPVAPASRWIIRWRPAETCREGGMCTGCFPTALLRLVLPSADGVASVQHPSHSSSRAGTTLPLPFQARGASRAPCRPGCALPLWGPYPRLLCKRSLENSLQRKVLLSLA